MTTAFASRRFLLSTVVWMDLYAGTRSRGDKRDLDRMVRVLTGVGRVVSPEPEDFYLYRWADGGTGKRVTIRAVEA